MWAVSRRLVADASPPSSPSRNTGVRNPSHLGSNRQPSPAGQSLGGVHLRRRDDGLTSTLSGALSTSRENGHFGAERLLLWHSH
jgi:hypothetical protein